MTSKHWISNLPLGLAAGLITLSALAQKDPLPDLKPVALLVPPVLTVVPGSNVTVICGITNQGDGPVDPGVPVWNGIYLSTTGVMDDSAQWLQSWYASSRLLPGAVYWETNVIQVPQIPSGSYYLILRADSGGILDESDESNNLFVVPVKFQILLPDLAPFVMECPSTLVGPPNPKTTLVWGATNQGDGGISATWSDTVYLSSKPVPDSSALQVGYVCEPRTVAAGGRYLQTRQVTLPITESGNYYLFFRAADVGAIDESNYSNNLVVVPITVEVQSADLTPITSSVPSVLTFPPNGTLTLTWGVTNQGLGLAINDWPWADRVYGSTNAAMDSSAICLGGGDGPSSLQPGNCYWRNETVRIPMVEDGTYYLFFSVDAFDYLFEANKSNNMAVVAVDLHITRPDLTPIALQVPLIITNMPYPRVTLTWGVTNLGIGEAIAPSGWTDSIYVSTNLISDPVGCYVWGSGVSTPAASGESYWITNTVAHAPLVNNGTYYFILRTDSGNVLPELDESNNTLIVPVIFSALPLPDLVPMLQIPATMKVVPNPVVTLIWGVTNQGFGPAIGYQPTSLIFTTDTAYVSLYSSSTITNVPPGGCVWWTNTVQLPVTRSGTYSFVLKSDLCDFVYESNETNNTATFPVAFDTGVVDLPPSLGIVASSTNAVIITWPLSVGWVLERSAAANPSPSGWKQVLSPQETNNGQIRLSMPPDSTNRFFRLRKL